MRKISKTFIYILFLILGIGMGIFLNRGWNHALEERKKAGEDFRYGMADCDIAVTDVEWKEFPVWNNITCKIQGNLVVYVPAGAEAEIKDLQNKDSLKETERETKVLTDENGRFFYDEVTYEIEEGIIRAEGLIKVSDNVIENAARGYRAEVVWEDGKDCLGCILPLNDTFLTWNSLQNEYSDRSVKPYLSAFRLSRTYSDTKTFSSLKEAETIKLIKKEGGIWDCIIQNEGTESWTFCAERPAVEMWYSGVWIELDTGIDSILMTSVCLPGDEFDITVPAEEGKDYKNLLPGLYRLVIYGTEEDYAATNIFEITE